MKDCKEDILYLVKKLDKLMAIDFNNRLKEFELTGQQARILFYINKEVYEGKSVHQNDIESQFGLSKSTVSGIIDRLEKKKFITKKRDNKFVDITPTEKSIEMCHKMHSYRQQTVEKLQGNLSEEEKYTLINTIKTLIINMEKEEE